jgi:hypothetical protein
MVKPVHQDEVEVVAGVAVVAAEEEEDADLHDDFIEEEEEVLEGVTDKVAVVPLPVENKSLMRPREKQQKKPVRTRNK